MEASAFHDAKLTKNCNYPKKMTARFYPCPAGKYNTAMRIATLFFACWRMLLCGL